MKPTQVSGFPLQRGGVSHVCHTAEVNERPFLVAGRFTAACSDCLILLQSVRQLIHNSSVSNDRSAACNRTGHDRKGRT